MSDIAELRLVGKEKEHYGILENVLAYAERGEGQRTDLSAKVQEMTEDWNAMLGGESSLPQVAAEYIPGIAKGDNQDALRIYLLFSPIFLYMHALHEISRGAHRNAVTACGRFCERIARNLLLLIDMAFNSKNSAELEDAKFENRNGRVKGILEKNGFEPADDLFMTMKKIYHVRDKRGPHDVPPPEPIQAKICINECLPTFMDYLAALDFLGVHLGKVREQMVRTFDSLTRTQLAVIFGEERKNKITAEDFIVNFLYREGFFGKGRGLREVLDEMTRRRFTNADSVVANALKKLSLGKEAILTRKTSGKTYVYYERIPPTEYFMTEF
ncbi:MAG: hypothetical protein ABSG74_01990 [Candidatus Bathyarchaeia archaeon]